MVPLNGTVLTDTEGPGHRLEPPLSSPWMADGDLILVGGLGEGVLLLAGDLGVRDLLLELILIYSFLSCRDVVSRCGSSAGFLLLGGM